MAAHAGEPLPIPVCLSQRLVVGSGRPPSIMSHRPLLVRPILFEGHVGKDREIGSILRARQLWLLGRQQLTLFDGVHAHRLEERVRSHLYGSAAALAAEPLGRIGDEELSDEVLGSCLDSRRVADLAVQDALVDPHDIFAVERHTASKHLVRENAERPPIGCEAVPDASDQLGRHVLRRAAEGPGARSRRPELLRVAVVDELEIARVVEHHVLGLDVSVDDLLAVEVRQRAEDVGAVEARRFVGDADCPMASAARDDGGELAADLVLMVAIAALTSFGTTSPRYNKQQAMYLP